MSIQSHLSGLTCIPTPNGTVLYGSITLFQDKFANAASQSVGFGDFPERCGVK